MDHDLVKCRSCRAAAPGPFGGPGATPHYPPHLTIEPTHILIDLALDLKAERASGRVVHTLAGRSDGARTLELDAVGFYDVKVKDLKGRATSLVYDGKKLRITWDEGFRSGETRELEVAYRVERPATGLFFMQPTKEDPDKAYYAATDHETERARYWLPTIDLPNVRTTLEFRLRAEEKLTILANGKLEGETKNGDGTKTAVWKLQQRCPSYLVCFAIGDFERFDDGDVDGIPLAYFASRDFSKQDLERSFGRTRPMLQWMQKLLGTPFPFPKYFQFALPAFGGAMENISLVSWSDYFVRTAATGPEGVWLTDQVNAHEMAHSYFGDLVVCRDFAHAWLKESWATYMEICWLEHAKGADEQLYDLYRCAELYFEEADGTYARPLVTRKFTSSWQMYDRHLYPGGACRLHTLRNELGETAFWNGVRDYLKTYAQQVVETDDFRRMLEKHSGRSLQKLFDQWVHSALYPNLKVSFSYDKEKGRGTFEIEQKQAEPFELRTDVGWVLDGKLHTQEVHLTKAKHSVTVTLAKEPEQVRFDPHCKVLHKLELNPGEDKLKAQLTGAKDVIGRILAAQALAESGKAAAVKAILDAWKKEPFWGVRRELVHALGKMATAEALKALAEIVGAEKDPLTLDAVFGTATKFRDAALAQAVETRVKKGDLAPGALAVALRALGAQRDAAPVATIEALAKKRDEHHGTVQAAALTALGMTRRPEAMTYLRTQLPYGKIPYRARRGAIVGMGAGLPHQEKPDRVKGEEALVDLLRDPEPWIQQQAARSLVQARATGSVEALEAYRRTIPLQEQVIVEAGIAALGRGDGDKVAALEKQIDDLTTKWRKLQERVDALPQT